MRLNWASIKSRLANSKDWVATAAAVAALLLSLASLVIAIIAINDQSQENKLTRAAEICREYFTNPTITIISTRKAITDPEVGKQNRNTILDYLDAAMILDEAGAADDEILKKCLGPVMDSINRQFFDPQDKFHVESKDYEHERAMSARWGIFPPP